MRTWPATTNRQKHQCFIFSRGISSVFGPHIIELWWLAHGQVSVLSFAENFGTKSSTLSRWVSRLVWAGLDSRITIPGVGGGGQLIDG